ncbi:MAG: isoaspartyl peptidase/L-asparaginase family protein [Anaerolineae bacterium]
MNRAVMVVHGGAWYIPAPLREDYVRSCREALLAGWRLLQGRKTALEAVEAAVRALEDDPLLDAGRGSYLNRAGYVEMDALIMDGRTLDLGAVAAVRRLRHPITLARKVLALPEHSFVVGEGALVLARELGMSLCDETELRGRTEDPEEVRWMPPEMRRPGDTVGAVALDVHGDVAVAVSTGGTPNKRPGRVGDSPLVGCGAYADNAVGGAVATGWGERLMRILTSKTACDFLAQGYPAQRAAEATISLLADRVSGYGGVILIDAEGRVGVAHNTPDMAYAYVGPEGQVVAASRRELTREGEGS